MDLSITKTLRFEIDEWWELDSMARFFQYVDGLYNFRYLLEQVKSNSAFFDYRLAFDKLSAELIQADNPRRAPTIGDDLDGLIYSYAAQKWGLRESALVTRLRYSSRGSIDIVGVGEIIGHLKDFFTNLIELKITSQQRKLENDERSLKNQSLQIENEKKRLLVEQEIKEKELRNSQIELENKEKALRNRQLEIENVYKFMSLPLGPISDETSAKVIDLVNRRQQVFALWMERGKILSLTILEHNIEPGSSHTPIDRA